MGGQPSGVGRRTQAYVALQGHVSRIRNPCTQTETSIILTSFSLLLVQGRQKAHPTWEDRYVDACDGPICRETLSETARWGPELTERQLAKRSI